MSVMTALYNSYVSCEENGFVDQSEKIEYETVLLPIYHSNMKSDGKNIIEVTLDKDSEIISAVFLAENERIIFPVTEESVSRAAGIAPHSLSEEVSYLEKEEEKKNNPDIKEAVKNSAYMKNLEKWIKYSDKKNKKSILFLKIIQKLLLKKDSLEKIFKECYKKDFISYSNGCLKVEKKDKEIDVKKIFITFKVQNLFDNRKDYSVTNYKELHKDYIEYMLEEEDKNRKEICNISGKELYCSFKHRGLFGTSKLISISNHDETYFGRLKKGEEIVSIGYETSQKMHNMLKYFLENKKNCINLGENSYLINWFSDDISNSENISLTRDVTDDLFNIETVEEEKGISDIYNQNISKYLAGNYRKINNEANYYIMVVNKISPGRLSVKYFREMRKSDFYERISDWYKSIGWVGYDYSKGSMVKKYPGIYKIIDYTYGVEREGKIEFNQKKHRRDLMESLLTVMVDGKKIPINLVKKMYSNICSRQRYDKTWNSLVELSCSVFKKYYIDYFKKEVSESMLEINDSDFLYGRLLAVFERVEELTFGDEKRSTNAQRLWSAYVNNPGKTMNTLINKLQPYKKKLENSKRRAYIYLENLTQEILMNLMKMENFENNKNKKLKENFIFGYYYQRNEFFKSNKNIED